MFEQEILALGDDVISLAVPGKFRPIGGTFHLVRSSYRRLPQIRPVRRVGQLADALQIEEISFSDVRSFLTILDQSPTGLTPMMQTRVKKLVIWVEDVIGDVDSLVMLPFNVTAEKIRGRDTHIRTVGYVGDGIGYVRRGVFFGFRELNKAVIHSIGRVLEGVEGVINVAIRAKRWREHRNDMVYLKMPPEAAQDAAADLPQVYVQLETSESRSLGEDDHLFQWADDLSIEGPGYAYAAEPLRQAPENDERVIYGVPIKAVWDAPPTLKQYLVDTDEIPIQS